jgi:hypothetical protein
MTGAFRVGIVRGSTNTGNGVFGASTGAGTGVFGASFAGAGVLAARNKTAPQRHLLRAGEAQADLMMTESAEGCRQQDH